MKQSEQKSRLALITAMLLFGTIGIFRKMIPLSSSMLAMLRGYIGATFLVLFVLLTGKKFSWRTIKANLVLLVISGIFIGFNWILLFEAYQYTTVAVATLCYYMAPVFVIIASPLIFGEKITIKKGICVTVALLGMILVSGVLGSGEEGSDDFRGILLGLGAAVLYASVVVMNKKIKDIAAYDKTAVQLGIAAIAITPYLFLAEEISTVSLTPFTVGMVLFVGVVHTGISYVLYFGSMKRLKAQTVALLSYIDPVVAIILSALLLRERMGILQAIGAVLVLCGTIVSELPDGEKRLEKV